MSYYYYLSQELKSDLPRPGLSVLIFRIFSTGPDWFIRINWLAVHSHARQSYDDDSDDDHYIVSNRNFRYKQIDQLFLHLLFESLFMY